MYHVSCSGDALCPQSYNTTNNHTRSHTFTGFTPNSYYTFSVVAINSIGSGEAGVVMVGEIINTTIAPSVVNMSTISTATTTSMSEGMTITSMTATTTATTTPNESMTVDMSSEIMMISTSTVDEMSTTMSSVSIAPSMTPTEDMATNATTTGVFSSPAGMTVILYYTSYCMIMSYFIRYGSDSYHYHWCYYFR